MEQTVGPLIEAAAELIAQSKALVVFTGAGISTESGIPDFRSPGGVWSKYDPEDFTYQKFLVDPDARRKHWELIRGSFFSTAQPNLAHHAIAELERLGRLECVITQNVDDLHQRAGNARDKVFELHGNLNWAICLSCGRRFSSDEVHGWLESGIEVPDCPACHGVLKPAAVFFGEPLPLDVLQGATEHARTCDLMVVIGSTLTVYPAAYMPFYALEAGARLVIINMSPTPLDREATVLIRGKAGEIMSLVVAGVKARMT